MYEVAAEQELLKACEILFGADLDVSREFLEYLQWSGIKTAYRQKARETHPDVAVIRGQLAEKRQSDLFRAVQEAYEHLTNYLNAREKGFSFAMRVSSVRATHGFKASRYRPQKKRPAQAAKKTAGARPKATSQNADFSRSGNFSQQKKRSRGPFNNTSQAQWWSDTGVRHNGPLPKRRLLFGHFLYYSGLIDWRTIIKALVWQRTKRPRLGEIGCRRGWLSERDVRNILQNRNILEPFGRSAVKMRLLNNRQVRYMVDEQKRLQRRFGEFFLEHKIFTPAQLHHLLVKYNAHNAEQVVYAAKKRA